MTKSQRVRFQACCATKDHRTAPTVYGIVAQVRTEGGFEEYHFAATSSRDQRKWRDALEGCNYERRLSIDSFGSTTSEGTDEAIGESSSGTIHPEAE